jgi:hypothetical protein
MAIIYRMLKQEYNISVCEERYIFCKLIVTILWIAETEVISKCLT